MADIKRDQQVRGLSAAFQRTTTGHVVFEVSNCTILIVFCFTILYPF